jgi:hypothetical protein
MLRTVVPVENPCRTAHALATLWEQQASPYSLLADRWLVGAQDGSPIAFIPGKSEAHERVAQLRVRTSLSVERVIEIACRLGFHAEPTWHPGTFLVEFWIDENFLLEVLTPESQACTATSRPDRCRIACESAG